MSRPVLVAIFDKADEVIGFGLPDFKPRQSREAGAIGSQWIANFFAKPGLIVRAFGIAADGQHICPLGDQSSLPTSMVPLASDRFLAAVPIVPERVITQSFETNRKLFGVMVQFVAWGKQPTSYMIRWQILGSMQNGEIELGAGELNSTEIRFWQFVQLPLSKIGLNRLPCSPDCIYGLRTDSDYRSRRLSHVRAQIQFDDPPVQINNDPAPSGGQMNLTLLYAD